MRLPGRPPAAVPALRSRLEAAPALFRLLSDSALARAALSACGLPLVLLDAAASGRPVTLANPAFEAFFGYSEADARGRSLVELLLRGDEDAAGRLFDDAESRWRLRAWRKDGTPLHVEAAVGAIRGSEGQVTHWVLAFIDRTELERVREELAALKVHQAAA